MVTGLAVNCDDGAGVQNTSTHIYVLSIFSWRRVMVAIGTTSLLTVLTAPWSTGRGRQRERDNPGVGSSFPDAELPGSRATVEEGTPRLDGEQWDILIFYKGSFERNPPAPVCSCLNKVQFCQLKLHPGPEAEPPSPSISMPDFGVSIRNDDSGCSHRLENAAFSLIS